MAKMWYVAAVLLMNVLAAQAQPATSPAQFIFGDSLIDPGNNNYIATIAKSNWNPNGIDFINGQATGRFCNGLTVADVIATKMNLPFPPPYLAPEARGPLILQGVNYASAAGGILDGTGANYIGRLSMNQQLTYFQNTQNQINQLVGPAAATQVYASALYYVTMGSNDYINNYLLPFAQTKATYTPAAYQNYLINTLSNQLTQLYNMGARKIAVFNVGPLGCIPSQLYQRNSPDGKCIDYINDWVVNFNTAMEQLLNQLTATLPGSTFVYGDAYVMVIDRIVNPGNYGLTSINQGCCGSGAYNGAIPCLPANPICNSRNTYLFWDPFHPTQAANLDFGQAFYNGPLSIIRPMNLAQLLAL